MKTFTNLSSATIINAFFRSGLDIDDVRAYVEGELLEDTYFDEKSGMEFTFTYGNGELIVSVDSDDENSRIFEANCYDGENYVLVEY